MKIKIENNVPNVRVTVNKADDGTFSILLVEDDKKKLGDISCGAVVKIGDIEYIVLDHLDNGGTAVITKEFAYNDMKFGDSADWRSSIIRAKLNNEFYNALAEIVGVNNIIPMTRDLTSLDGLRDYGECEDMVSLLTMDEYRKYHEILGLMSNYLDWWWTITPFSTPSNNYSRGVCYVISDGTLNWCDCGYGSAVRPFCILDSSVLVSCEE